MKILNYFLVIALVLVSCKGKEPAKEQSVEEPKEEAVVEKAEAVCVTDGVSVRKEPHKEGKWLSRLNLGEKVTYLGKSQVDSTDKNKNEYHLVELSDGSQAWAYGYGVLLNAKPGAIVKKTPLYSRPDLVTKTSKELEIMDFVAIVGEKDDWLEVVGEKKRKKGWVKSKRVTTKVEDVAVATLAHKSIKDKNGKIVAAKIAGFLDELPYENSQFKSYLQEKLDEEVGEVIEAGIEELELEEAEEAAL